LGLRGNLTRSGPSLRLCRDLQSGFQTDPAPIVTSKPHPAGHSAKRSKRNLVALGSAAVIAVYTAGFFHTAEAARKLATDERQRSESSGRGSQGPSSRAEPAPAPSAVTTATPAATPANALPVPAPVAPPAAAVAPAQSAVAVTPPPSAPVVTALPVTTTMPVSAATSPAPTVAAAPAPVVPASSSVPVPTTPVPVAALPASPATATAVTTTAAGAPAATPAVAKKYKDGAFFGWGRCRHGDLKVIVELKDDKIVSAEIAECYTRYSKNVISRLPKQLTDRQNPDKLDRISGASDSSDAYYYAVVEALKAAKL
jgi:uncharacterized protein with FMN-binding domain